MTSEAHIVAEVRALERLDLEGLRAEWRRRFGDPPDLRSQELVRLSLAWRMQVAVLGGLDAGLRRRLRQGRGAPVRPDGISVGDSLVREWRGVVHRVDRSSDGLVWNGHTYRSLSAVAQAITGVKRNGPQFFGLREER